MSPVTALLAVHVAAAESGVDFSRRHGARCPCCHQQARIIRTLPWEENVRIRYHRCRNPHCLLSSAKITIKSVEVDR